MARQPALHQLSKHELLVALRTLQQSHHITSKDITQAVDHDQNYLPADIFIKELSALESICVYLKDQKQLTYHQIAELLGRNDRTIWTTYNKAKQKHAQPFTFTTTPLLIPANLFKNRTFSVLEHLVKYLKEQHDLTYHQIGEVLHRNERTIWTIYHRAQKKQ